MQPRSPLPRVPLFRVSDLGGFYSRSLRLSRLSSAPERGAPPVFLSYANGYANAVCRCAVAVTNCTGSVFRRVAETPDFFSPRLSRRALSIAGCIFADWSRCRADLSIYPSRSRESVACTSARELLNLKDRSRRHFTAAPEAVPKLYRTFLAELVARSTCCEWSLKRSPKIGFCFKR